MKRSTKITASLATASLAVVLGGPLAIYAEDVEDEVVADLDAHVDELPTGTDGAPTLVAAETPEETARKSPTGEITGPGNNAPAEPVAAAGEAEEELEADLAANADKLPKNPDGAPSLLAEPTPGEAVAPATDGTAATPAGPTAGADTTGTPAGGGADPATPATGGAADPAAGGAATGTPAGGGAPATEDADEIEADLTANADKLPKGPDGKPSIVAVETPEETARKNAAGEITGPGNNAATEPTTDGTDATGEIVADLAANADKLPKGPDGKPLLQAQPTEQEKPLFNAFLAAQAAAGTAGTPGGTAGTGAAGTTAGTGAAGTTATAGTGTQAAGTQTAAGAAGAAAEQAKAAGTDAKAAKADAKATKAGAKADGKGLPQTSDTGIVGLLGALLASGGFLGLATKKRR